MTDRIPAEVFPPGDFILEELEAREWTQEDFARILGKPLPTVNRIINGKSAITPETAKRVAAAFGTSAQLWLNLESAWQLSQTDDDADQVRSRARIYEMAPIREMVRRGWIKNARTPEELKEQLQGHFCVDDLSTVPQVRAAAKSSVSGERGEMTPEQWAWICMSHRVSSLVDARKFKKKDLEDAIPELKALCPEPESIRHVPKILSAAGVRLVVVQHLSRTKIDGAALERDRTQPVIALSLRYGRLDNFWHVLLHEIAHILYGDGVTVDSDIHNTTSNVDEAEARANQMASEWLVPSGLLDSFILRTGPLYSTRRVTNFARRVGVHPSIVAGQLKHRGEVGWDKLTKLNVDVRDLARQSNISDGWGDPAPIE